MGVKTAASVGHPPMPAGRKSVWTAWLAAALLLAGLRAGWAAEGLSDVAVEKDVMVPMRDGVRLATDVYLPAQDGKPIDGQVADDPRAAAVQQGRVRASTGPLLRGARLRLRRPGYARALQVGGRLAHADRRRPRRRRHRRVDRPSSPGPTARSA